MSAPALDIIAPAYDESRNMTDCMDKWGNAAKILICQEKVYRKSTIKEKPIRFCTELGFRSPKRCAAAGC